MKVAILIQAYGRFGGAERAALLHYTHLKAMGKDVDMFADFTDKHLWARAGLERTPFKPLPRGLRSSDDLTGSILRTLEAYDRVLVHHHIEPILAYRIVRHLAKKTAWYSGSVFEPVYSDLLHGEDYRKVSLTFQTTTKSFYGRGVGGLGLALFPISKRILKIIDYETVRKFHKIITNSGYQSRYIQNIYRRDSTVVYPPIESALLSADELPLMVDRPFVLMVGAFVPYKNFQAGIRAMIPIKETHSLAMVGTGLLKEQYEELASKLGIDLHIFYGSNDAIMHSLYAKASFLIHPSLFEGFGFIPAEAALHRKPTILTTRSGVKELLKDEESSYFCDPSNLPLMQQRAKSLATSPEAASVMGCKAYDSVQMLCTMHQSSVLWDELEAWN
jgi:glycosyltransferase involved in cell wall biosynthesis